MNMGWTIGTGVAWVALCTFVGKGEGEPGKYARMGVVSYLAFVGILAIFYQ
jgi:hypothetical protein